VSPVTSPVVRPARMTRSPHEGADQRRCGGAVDIGRTSAAWQRCRSFGASRAAQLKHPARGGRVTVPLHAGETIGPGLLRSIMSQEGLSADDLRAVL
jgi:predicted RNA binding protein YcfA (HicA-like mRNA interferase family)